MARDKRKKETGKIADKLYLGATLVVVAVVAIFLGYLVGQYAIQVATDSLDRGLIREGQQVRQKMAQMLDNTAKTLRNGRVSTSRAEDGQTGAGAENVGSGGSGAGSGEELNRVKESPAGNGNGSREKSGSLSQSRLTSGSQRTSSTPRKQLYRVQVGAFSEEANARRLADKLRQAGYPVLVKSGSLYRVQVGAFSQRSNAEALLQELKAGGYQAVIIAEE